MMCNMRLGPKLWLIQGLTFVALLVVTMVTLKLSWDARLDERKAKLQDMVVSANAILAHVDEQAQAGRLTRDEATREARKIIQLMSFNHEEYLFMTSFDGTFLANRAKYLVGQNMLNARDSDGRAFVQEQIAVAKAGGGFVHYWIRRPESNIPAPKLSYVAVAPGWNAIIGMGVFIDDLTQKYWQTATMFLTVISAVFALTLFLSARIAISIVRPMRTLLSTIDELSEGHHQARIEGLQRRDEVGDLARGVLNWKEHAMRRMQLQEEIEAARQQLLHQATHDELTGLPNGPLLMETLKEWLREGRPTTVIIIGKTGLDRIAAYHGPSGWSHVMRSLAARLRGFCGEQDFFARLDGDTFAVLTSDGEPEALASNIRMGLSAPILWSSLLLHVPVSIGLASSVDGEDSADGLVQAAIVARNNANSQEVVRYRSELRARVERESQVESRLISAVAQGRISLALQPKVRAIDGVLVGAEALARWHDDELGSVPPTEFIPIAERIGIIGNLDSIILRRALEEAANWQKAGLDLVVAVNVSAIELRSGDLLGRIAAALSAAECGGSQLIVELTESAIAENPAYAVQQLSALKGLGVSLSLDDFGTGYSSLSYLRRFPLDTLKIDRSFVIDTPGDGDAVKLAHTIVGLARSLSMETVAEGVETEDQAAFLRQLGVNTLQGYLYGRPMPPEQFLEIAKRDVASQSAG